MSPTSLFQRGPDQLHLRLALEDWTELPAHDSKGWHTLIGLLKPWCEFVKVSFHEARHNGSDLYLLLAVREALAFDALAESIRVQFRDPFWQPYFDTERFAWVGRHHFESVRPGDTLRSQTLEHPARRAKRAFLERELGRSLANLWHDAPTPEAVGIEFLAGLTLRCSAQTGRLDLFYRKPESGEREAWAAALLNTRLRLPGDRRRFESVGWDRGGELAQLVFSVPPELLTEPRASLEVWWATDARRSVTQVPCFVEDHEPPEFRRDRWIPLSKEP